MDVEAPKIPRHLTHRRQCKFRESPAPFAPGRLFTTRKVEAFDYLPALPPPIGGILRPEQGIAAGGNVTAEQAVYGYWTNIG